MPSAKLTKRSVDQIRPEAKPVYWFDSELPGFFLRVMPSGAKSWGVEYRPGSGRQVQKKRVTLGAFGKLAPEQARQAARQVLATVTKGGDPAADKAHERAALTLSALADVFYAEHMVAKRKPSTAAWAKDIIDRTLKPEFGTTGAHKITRGAVAKLHARLKETPHRANAALALISSMYGFASKRGIVEEGMNPARGIEKYRTQSRERFLTSEELERLGAAIREAETAGIPWTVDRTTPNAKHIPVRPESCLTTIGPHAAAALRLLLFTGARLREILHLQWQHVDLERGLLFLPDSKTGKKTIVLSAPAVNVLTTVPRVGAFVIAGNNPEKPRADLKRPWELVCQRARLEGVRIHDLRHSFASVGAGGGLGLPIIGKLLGHADVKTTQRYAHLDNDPLRRATDIIAGKIAAAMGEQRSLPETTAPSHSP